MVMMTTVKIIMIIVRRVIIIKYNNSKGNDNADNASEDSNDHNANNYNYACTNFRIRTPALVCMCVRAHCTYTEETASFAC